MRIVVERKSIGSLRDFCGRFIIVLVLLFSSFVYPMPGGGIHSASPSSDKVMPAIAGTCSLGNNLIINGSAEGDPNVVGNGTDNYDVSGWLNEIGDFTVVRYGAEGGYPTVAGPGPENRGAFFFGGGRTASSTATQTIDLAGCAEEVDAGSQRFSLSGYLGGWSSNGDNAKVVASFRSLSNAELGTTTIGPVTPAERANITGLFPRSSSAVIPAGTRTVEIKLELTRFVGTVNDGYADDISFSLIEPRQSCAPLPSNILSWWKAEGNANDYLETNNGVLRNGTSFSAGLVGQSFSFDGVDDHVTLSRNIQDSFTIEFWINTTQLVTGSGQWYAGRGLVDAEVRTVTNDFGVSLLNGKIYFGTGNPDTTIISTNPVADGNWHHIAATRNRSNGNMRLYVDGNVIGSAVGGTQSLTAPPRIVIGRIQVDENPFLGKLDEISIYDRALSLTEVQSIYSAGSRGKCGLNSIQAIALNPNPVNGGAASTGTLTLASPAPAEGAIVELTSNDPVAQVPPSIIIPSGSTTGEFTVLTSIPAVDTPALITATYEGESISATLNVIAPHADLAFGPVNAPSAAVTDQAFNLTWNVVNSGNAQASGPWTDRIYLSTDNQPGGDTQISAFPFTGNIPVGQTAARVQSVTIPAGAVSANGPHFLIVITDADGQVAEISESNNFIAIPISVTRPPKPDLIVENITAPATAFFNQSITVQFTVKNIGDGPTNASDWRDYLYFSVDAIPEIEDPFKISLPNTSYLAPGESYTTSVNITIPRGLAGSYKVIAWADSDGSNHRNNFWPQRVPEVSEENNFGIALPIQLNVPPLPDLQVSTVAAPGEVFAGGEMALTWRVENLGDSATPQDQIAWKDNIFLSDNTVLDAADRLVASRERSGALAPKEGYTVSNYTFTLPNDVAGPKYVFVVADGSDKVYEFLSENNNSNYDRQQPGSPMQIGATPPDLIVTGAITAPATGNTGQPVAISFTVQNQGAFEAAPGWFDSIYISQDQNLDTSTDTLLTSVFRNAPLGPGLSYNVTANAVLPSCLEGTYYIYVVTDGRNQIFEYDPKQNAEQNNTSQPRSIAISNVASDLVVSSVSHPPTGSAGQPLSVSWSVANNGVGPTQRTVWTDHVYLSPSPVFSSSATLVGSFDHTGALNSGQSYSRTENISIPTTMQGQYFVIVLTDAKGEEEECANNANNSGNGGGTVSITNNLPDLVIQAASTQANFVGGQTVNIGWTVANNGTVAANNASWGDAVFFSDNNVLGGDDRRLGTVPASGPLAVGASYDRQLGVTLPVVTPGTYYLIVQADYLNNVFEGQAETNNTRAVVIPIEVPGVDLRIDSINAPTTALSGQTINVSWAGTNAGANETVGSTWTDEVVLSADQIADPTDRVIGYTRRNAPLNGGQSYQGTAAVSIPSGLAGQYYIFTRADRNNQIAESDETNNNGPLTPVYLDLTPPADLVVTSVTYVPNATPGEVVTFTWRVQNNGSNPALGVWNDVVYLSVDQTWDANDEMVGRSTQLGPTPAGQFYEGTLQTTFPVIQPGNYYVIIRTDVRNRVRETNEGNNTGISAGTLGTDIPELQLGLPQSTTLVQDQQKAYKFNVAADETVRVSLDGQDGSSTELFTRFDRVATRSTYDFLFDRPNEPDQQIFIPRTSSGTYYNLLRSLTAPASLTRSEANKKGSNNLSSKESSTSAAESVTIKAEIVPFGITSVSPQRGGNAGKVTVQLSGSKFEWRSKILLKNSAGAIVVEKEGIFTDSTSLKSQLDLTGIPPGQYSISVKLPNGNETTWSQPFTIVEGGAPNMVVSTSGPVTARVGRSSYFLVTYRNDGLIDFEDPIIVIKSDARVRIDADVPFGWPMVPDNRGENNPLEVVKVKDIPPDLNNTIGFYVTPLEGDLNIPFSLIFARNPTRSPQARPLENNSPDIDIDSRLKGGTVRTLSPGDVPEPGTIIFTSGVSRTGHMGIVVKINNELMVFENQIDRFSISPRNIEGGSRLTRFDLFMSNVFPLESNPDGNWAATYSPLFSQTQVNDITNWVRNHTGPNRFEYDIDFKCTEAVATAIRETTGYSFNFDKWTAPSDIYEELTGKTFAPGYLNFSLRLPKLLQDESLNSLLKGQYNPWSCYYLGLGCLPGFGPGFGFWGLVNGVNPFDPNDKIGPQGFGPEQFIAKDPIPYTINFENVSTATAPAQRIRITDQLDPNLDWRTFRLKEIGFKQYRFQVPENRAFFQQRVQLGADLNNLVADISAGVDISTGTVTWTLTAIDPATGEQPNAADLGLLPPNNENNDGQGFVTFTVRPKSTAPTGTILQNKATIVFDTEEPIETNVVSNTLDADAPSSAVASLPLISEPEFTVTWSGVDTSSGSGLRSYDVFVSENEGPYTSLAIGTTETSRQFTGSRGKTYRFYSVSYDNAGNKEEVPTVPDSLTTVAGGAFEADVDPRPNGSNDGTVSVADKAQVARFVVGLETPDQPTSTNEFQRADSAPRSSRGNGSLAVSDITQTGRYAAGLDAAQTVGESLSPSQKQPRAVSQSGPSSELRPVRIARIGNKLTVGIELVTPAGGEQANAAGFTLDYDASVLSNPSNIVAGSDAGGASIVFNTGQNAQGRLGVAVYNAAGQSFSVGARQIVRLEFDIAAGAPTSTNIGFSDQVAVRQLANTNADSISANFTPAAISLTSPTAATVTIGGRILNAAGYGIGNARIVLTGTDGSTRSTVTNPFGYYSFTGISAGTTVMISVITKQYSFDPGTRLIRIDDDNYEINFTSNN